MCGCKCCDWGYRNKTEWQTSWSMNCFSFGHSALKNYGHMWAAANGNGQWPAWQLAGNGQCPTRRDPHGQHVERISLHSLWQLQVDCAELQAPQCVFFAPSAACHPPPAICQLLLLLLLFIFFFFVFFFFFSCGWVICKRVAWTFTHTHTHVRKTTTPWLGVNK